MKKVLLSLSFFLIIGCLSAQHVRILTYNIHHGNPPAHADKIDLQAIAEVVRTSRADLVGIQEVDVRVPRSGLVDQAFALAELTGMHYYFSKGIDYDGGEYGTLILSKHKIVGNRRYDLPMVVAGENRSLAVVDVLFPNGKTISFANTHLDLKADNKAAQANYITELGDWYDRPLILVGDLNAAPSSAPLQTLERYFVRNTEKNGPTHPNKEAKSEIDYIMVGKHTHFTWREYKTIRTDASDHLPVYAEIDIR